MVAHRTLTPLGFANRLEFTRFQRTKHSAIPWHSRCCDPRLVDFRRNHPDSAEKSVCPGCVGGNAAQGRGAATC
jgi:hypothetical protein